VIDTVAVAVHVHGNATMIVIQPVNGTDATAESAAHLDVMKVEELIDDEQYAVGGLLHAHKDDRP
jgi:hypothetical protein